MKYINPTYWPTKEPTNLPINKQQPYIRYAKVNPTKPNQPTNQPLADDRRSVELKHGRIAMLATMGHLAESTWAGTKKPAVSSLYRGWNPTKLSGDYTTIGRIPLNQPV